MGPQNLALIAIPKTSTGSISFNPWLYDATAWPNSASRGPSAAELLVS